jgi:hypothetical protein
MCLCRRALCALRGLCAAGDDRSLARSCCRFCDPTAMDAHERRNDLPPANERDTEFLVHGTFAVAEDDRGFFDTRWLTADSILENIDKAVFQAKVSRTRRT